MRAVIIIPARLGSQRLARKPLIHIHGVPLLVWTWCRAKKSGLDVVIATDSDEIRESLEQFGARVEMTRSDHQSGTERVAEVAAHHPEWDVILNVQGDEPLHSVESVNSVAARCAGGADIVTLAHPLEGQKRLEDPSQVKVVLNDDGQAMYFSRSAIPHGCCDALGHVGIYGFRRVALLECAELKSTPLEQAERLEQLRWLEHGRRIQVLIGNEPVRGVDTEDDLKWVEARLESHDKPEKLRGS